MVLIEFCAMHRNTYVCTYVVCTYVHMYVCTYVAMSMCVCVYV